MGTIQEGKQAIVAPSIDLTVGTDGSASTTKMARIGGTDGTNDQTLYMDPSGRPYTNRNWSIAGEDAVNGRTDVNMKYRDSTQDATASITVNGTTEGAANTVVDWTDVSHFNAFMIHLANTGATALTNVYVYIAPTAADTYRVNVASLKSALEIACQTLTASGGATPNGIAFSGTAGHGVKYIKVTATVAAGSTTVLGWLEKIV